MDSGRGWRRLRGHGRGRGRGRGRGGRGEPGGAAAGAPQQGKYAWVDIDYHNFTPRASWEAAALPKLGKLFDGLDHDSEPWRFFEACDALEQEYRDRATNSEKYRYHRFIKDLDGPGKKCYDGAADITYADMRYLDAALLLNGLDPAVSHQTRSAPLLPNFSHAPLGAVRA